MKEVEKKRLFLQAKKRKEEEVKKIFPSPGKVKEKIDPRNVSFEIEFKNEEDLHKFLSNSLELVELLRFELKAEGRKIKLNYREGVRKEVEKALDFLYTLNSFHLAESFSIIQYGKKVLFKSCELEEGKIGIPKKPYETRSTFHFQEIGLGEKEKDRIKKIIAEYYSSFVGYLITKTSEDRYLTFESLSKLGEEPHIKWREKLPTGYEKIFCKKCNSTMIMKLVKDEDAFSFYPALFQDKEFEGEKLGKIKTRMVIEVDPSKGEEGFSYEVGEILNEKFKRARFFFSGGKSVGVQFEIDHESILKNIFDAYEEFPFLGFFLKKSFEDCSLVELYKGFLKGFEHALYFKLLDELKERNYQYWKLTMQPNSIFRNFSVLLDFPHTVYVAEGSVKKIWRIEKEKIPKDLCENPVFKEKWYDSPFHLLVCTFIEKAPRSFSEVLKESHILFAREKFEEKFEERINSYPKFFGYEKFKEFVADADEKRIEEYLINPHKFERKLRLI